MATLFEIRFRIAEAVNALELKWLQRQPAHVHVCLELERLQEEHDALGDAIGWEEARHAEETKFLLADHDREYAALQAKYDALQTAYNQRTNAHEQEIWLVRAERDALQAKYDALQQEYFPPIPL